MIAVEVGHNKSLKEIQELYKSGYATKDDYENMSNLYRKADTKEWE